MTDIARILASTSSPQFYPSQFVLVTDILDVFGQLVYNRLLSKANEKLKDLGLAELSDGFSLKDIPEAVQEVAKNWLCKVGTITELLPRVYG